DTTAMTATVPEVKRKQIVKTLRMWSRRAYITLTELQSLVGSLMWITQVVPLGRIFIQALINKTKGRTKSSTKIRLNRQCQLDIQWWLHILPQWSGIHLLEELY